LAVSWVFSLPLASKIKAVAITKSCRCNAKWILWCSGDNISLNGLNFGGITASDTANIADFNLDD